VFEPAHRSPPASRTTGSEDFARFLECVPGCFVFVGYGEHSAPLHNAVHDFNDEGLLYGASFRAAIIRQRMRSV